MKHNLLYLFIPYFSFLLLFTEPAIQAINRIDDSEELTEQDLEDTKKTTQETDGSTLELGGFSTERNSKETPKQKKKREAEEKKRKERLEAKY